MKTISLLASAFCLSSLMAEDLEFDVDVLELTIGETKLGEKLAPNNQFLAPKDDAGKRFQVASGDGYALHFKDGKLESALFVIHDFKGTFMARNKKISLTPETSIHELSKLIGEPHLVGQIWKSRDVACFFLRNDSVEVMFIFDDYRLSIVNLMDFGSPGIAKIRNEEFSEIAENKTKK